jgi:hypothetical protein
VIKIYKIKGLIDCNLICIKRESVCVEKVGVREGERSKREIGRDRKRERECVEEVGVREGERDKERYGEIERERER